jgi:hypothetical protein
VPGYFEWKVRSADGQSGAFSSPPATFNIATPYIPAPDAAKAIVLAGLQQQMPGVTLERVHPLPRVGAYYRGLLKAIGIGSNPQVDKTSADFLATAGGRQIRIRATIATVMLDSSPLLGGRGNWMLMCSGAWAPADQFDQLYPVGRGVISSLITSESWNNAMFEAAGDVSIWKGWIRRWRQFLFNIVYLEAEESAPN